MIIQIALENGMLNLSLGPWLLLLMVMAIIFVFVKFLRRFSGYEVVEADLKIAGIGSVKIKPNSNNIQIAHSAWVEITTRKVSLPFDEENDVIVERYNAYFQRLERLRDLTKGINANSIRANKETKALINIMVKVLNNGLRPHLTRWQARFRKWYDEARLLDENKGLAPQDIQRKYPEYKQLKNDLKILQNDMTEYTLFLKNMAQGEE